MPRGAYGSCARSCGFYHKGALEDGRKLHLVENKSGREVGRYKVIVAVGKEHLQGGVDRQGEFQSARSGNEALLAAGSRCPIPLLDQFFIQQPVKAVRLEPERVAYI